MHYPLINRNLLAELRYVHAFYNTSVALLFFYQARLGLAIRSARKAKGPLPFPLIKRHRSLGPVLVVLGGLGFCIGLTLVLLDSGRIFEFPPHLFTGTAIVVLLLSTFVTSRRIKGQASRSRTVHFFLGLAILGLYVLEVILGIGVLF